MAMLTTRAQGNDRMCGALCGALGSGGQRYAHIPLISCEYTREGA